MTIDDNTTVLLPNAVILYNFDAIASANRAGKVHTVGTVAKKILKHGQAHAKGCFAVHTTVLDAHLAETFSNAGVPLVTKNLDYRSHALSSLLHLLPLLFRQDSRLKRKYLRLDFGSSQKYTCTLASRNNTEVQFDGNIKDISLNGVGFSLKEAHNCSRLNLKEPVNISLVFNKSRIEIKLGFVTRLYSMHNEIGVSFNIRNVAMVSEKNSVELINLFEQWLKEVNLPTGP